jgi:CDGSH iron-sulfur domain-containing protein 3
MSEPTIVQKKPIVLDMEPGIYHWCACGLSKNQPFCDGSHKTTDITPVETKIDEKRKVAWCACKHSKNKPFCDGTHKTL